MLSLPVLCCCISLALLAAASQDPLGPAIPGIGFGLTVDYGTIAIYLPNKTAIALAKVEGGSQYKAFMRRQEALPPDEPFCSIRGSCLRKADFNAAYVMIDALKDSAEAYFGTTFCFADITAPGEYLHYQKAIIEKAFKMHGIRQAIQGTLNAAKLAVSGNMDYEGELPEAQVVMAIDYSRSGLNLDMFCNDIGVIDPIAQNHRLGIGADSSELSHWDEVRSAIDSMKRMAFGQCPLGKKHGNQIDYLVLYGDSTNDSLFRSILIRSLGLKLVEEAKAGDPEFISALSTASASYFMHNGISFEGKPALGCRWRSRLYWGRDREL